MLTLRLECCALLSFGLLTSCATVHTQTSERVVARGELVVNQVTRHPASDLLRLHASSCRDQLVVSGTLLKACRRERQQRVAVDRDVVRQAPAVGYEALAAVALVAGGALLASQTVPGCDDSDPPDCQGSDAWFSTGLTIAAGGLVLGGVSVFDAWRATDDHERVQGIETSKMLEWCGEEPARGRGVSVALPNTQAVSGRLDESGAVSLALSPGVSAPATVPISVDGAPPVATPVRELCGR